MSVVSQTVNPLSIAFMLVSLLLCFGVPIGLAIWAKVHYKKSFSFLPLLFGVLGFAIFQMVIRVSILLPWALSIPWFKKLSELPQPWLYAAILCLTAGLFEEPVRFLAYSILNKKRQFPDGLSYGIGHGGIEAIGLVGLTYINNIAYSVMINTGVWEKMLSTVPAAYHAQLAQVQQALIGTAPSLFLLGGMERVFTMAIQIAFSILVLRGFQTNRKWWYLILATLLHAAVDFVAVALQILKVNSWLIEGVLFVIAVVAVLYIVQCARRWRREQPQPPEPAAEAAQAT